MIMPGLLTASTNKADHFGMSGDGLLYFSISVAPSVLRALVFGLKTVFPLVRTLGHEWVPDAHPKGRNEVQQSKRSGECDPFPRNDSSRVRD